MPEPPLIAALIIVLGFATVVLIWWAASTGDAEPGSCIATVDLRAMSRARLMGQFARMETNRNRTWVAIGIAVGILTAGG